MVRIDVILRTKDADEKKYKENQIPWSNKLITEVKHASLVLMEKYMKLVLVEVEALKDKEKNSERLKEKQMNLLTGTIRFAFKIHQFAGGFTDSCSASFAEVAAKTRGITAA